MRLRVTYGSINKAEEASGLSSDAYGSCYENVGDPLFKASSSFFSNFKVIKDSQNMDMTCKVRKEVLKEVFHALLDNQAETTVFATKLQRK